MRLIIDGGATGARGFLTAAAGEYKTELAWLEGEDEPMESRVLGLACPGDIVVTGDLGLAAVCASRGCRALSPRGFWFFEKASAAKPKAGRKAGKKKKTKNLDDQRFEEEIVKALKAGTGSGARQRGKR